MKIKQTIEKKVGSLIMSLEEPKNIHIRLISSKHGDDFIDLKLKGEDLNLSVKFCEMIKKNIIQNVQEVVFEG